MPRPSGAFDSFGELRREQFFGQSESGLPYLDALLTYGQRFQMESEESTNSLFGGSEEVEISKPKAPVVFERWSDLEKLNRERELIGIYISGHPLDDYSIVLNNLCTIGMPEVADLNPFLNQEITFGGIVTNAEESQSRSDGSASEKFASKTSRAAESSSFSVTFGHNSKATSPWATPSSSQPACNRRAGAEKATPI